MTSPRDIGVPRAAPPPRGLTGVRAKYTPRLVSAGDGVSRHALLLRRTYLVHLEARRFEVAAAIAREMVVAGGGLLDVAHEDCARVELALGNAAAAVGHVRTAARVAPASRKAFHWWTLGSLLYLTGQPGLAVDAFQRAERWARGSLALFRAQRGLAQAEVGTVGAPDHEQWAQLRRELERSAAASGYGQWVLGLLAWKQGDRDTARALLGAFRTRIRAGRVASQVTLRLELELADRLLEGEV